MKNTTLDVGLIGPNQDKLPVFLVVKPLDVHTSTHIEKLDYCRNYKPTTTD